MSTNSSAIVNIIEQKLAPLLPHMADPDVQEIMINGEDTVFVERSGKIEKLNLRISKISIEGAIKLFAKLNNKDVVSSSRDAIVNARISGFRIAAAIEPVSVFGPSISIRKHNPKILSLDDYVKQGQLNDSGKSVLEGLVRDHKNILIVGSTSSGKTTLLNALASIIDPSEAVRSVEDTQEIKVSAPNWVAFESNEQNGVTQRDLVRLLLRYRPDRILLGEVRGPEAYDLMQAANTGHDGIMSTLHASSARRGLIRFENLVMESGSKFTPLGLKRNIADAFDAVIFAARTNGVRKIVEIIQIDGVDDQMQYLTTTLYSCKES